MYDVCWFLLVCYYIWSIWLLVVVCYFPVCLSCVVFLVSCFRRCFPFGYYDGCIFILQTVKLFLLYDCLILRFVQLLVRNVWLSVCWVLFMLVLLVCYYIQCFVCCLLFCLPYVCSALSVCWATFVCRCCFLLVDLTYNHVVRIVIIIAVLFELLFCTVVRRFWLYFRSDVLFVVFVCMLLHITSLFAVRCFSFFPYRCFVLCSVVCRCL